MQRNWLLLLILGVLLVVPAGAGEPASGDPLAPLEKMNTPARQAWVETMLARLDEANRVVLAPEAVTKQHARFEQSLRGFVENRADWRAQVASFEEELVLSQRAAIEHLTRRYRLEAYQQFRNDRAGFEQCRLILERLMTAWRRSASPRAEQHKLIAWLDAATQRSVEGKLASLPPLPDFRAGRAAVASAPPAALPEVDLGLPSVSRGPGVPLAGPRPARWLADRIGVTAGPELSRPAAFHTAPDVELPLAVHASSPRPNHVALIPSFEPVGFAASLRPTMVASSSRTTWRRPASVAVVTRPMSSLRPSVASRSASPSPASSGDPLAFARTRVDRLTMVSTFGRTARPDNATTLGSGTPGRTTAGSAALARAGSAPADSYQTGRVASGSLSGDSLASFDPRRSSLGEFPKKNASGPRLGESAAAGAPNMDELAARIRGNNVALRKLAAQLYEDRRWDAKSLSAILDQLTPLVERKDDLKLVCELIPPQHRDRVGDLESGSDLISDLGTKIARARTQIEQGDFPGSSGERKAELDQLDRLSQKLASLVFTDR